MCLISITDLALKSQQPLILGYTYTEGKKIRIIEYHCINITVLYIASSSIFKNTLGDK